MSFGRPEEKRRPEYFSATTKISPRTSTKVGLFFRWVAPKIVQKSHVSEICETFECQYFGSGDDFSVQCRNEKNLRFFCTSPGGLGARVRVATLLATTADFSTVPAATFLLSRPIFAQLFLSLPSLPPLPQNAHSSAQSLWPPCDAPKLRRCRWSARVWVFFFVVGG